MTLEEEDKTELRKVPAKSILKSRPIQTVTESPTLPNEGTSDHLIKFQNRRVSFANKVKLHQIDFVPVSHESTENEIDNHSITSDLDDSFLKIEQDTDAIVEAIVEHEAIGSPSEQETMELTAQIEAFQKVALPQEEFSKIPDSGESHSQELTVDTNAMGAGSTTENTENPEASNIEEDMELTAPISLPISEPHTIQAETLDTSHSEPLMEQPQHSVPEIKTAFDAQATSTQNDENNTINSHNLHTVGNLSGNPEEVQERITEGDLTTNQQEEVTMDLTSQNQQQNSPSIAQNAEVNNFEVAAVDVRLTNEHEPTEEITMDITKPFEGPVVEDRMAQAISEELPDSSDFEDDVPMELTQPITILKVSNEGIALSLEGTVDEANTENQESALDAPTSTTEPVSPSNLNTDGKSDSELLHHNGENRNMEPSEALNNPLPELAGKGEALNHIGHEFSSEKEVSSEASQSLPVGGDKSVDTPLEADSNTPELNQPETQTTQEMDPKSPVYEAAPYETNTPDMDQRNETLKRKAELPEVRAEKKSHWEAHVVTSTIPLADVSTLSWDDDDGWEGSIPHFSLTDFLKEIGIKFYDDLEFSTELSTRHRLSLSEPKEENTKEDYYRANIQLPLLEVYGLSCKELTGKIQQGKKLFDELQEKTLSDNPELFKHYYRASYYDQMGMKARFHLLKEYTRQQAKLIWYQWRSKLIENILEVLLNNLEVLQSDKATLLNNISILDEVYEEIQQKFQSLRLEVQQFKEIQNRFKDLDADQIKKIKLQLTELNNRLIEHKEKISQKETELKLIGDQIQMRNEEIVKVRNKLLEAEDQLNNTKHFNTSEIEVLEYKSRLLQAAAGIKFVRNISKHVDEFEFNSELGLRIDFSKPDSPDSTTFHLLHLENKLLHNRNLLEYCCSDLVEATGFTNVFESLISLRKRWIKLTELDRDIYRISLRYPVKIIKSEKKEILFEFQYFSFKNNFKAQVGVSLPVHAILQYPQAVQTKIKTLRNATGPQDKEVLEKEAKLGLPDAIAARFIIALEG